jgi:hypothetical protein
MLCLILATSISGVMTTRSAARLQLGQLDLLERLETYESRLDHRDGKIYMAVARVNAGHDALARRMADLEEVTSEQPGLRHPSTAQAEIVRIGARITSKITGE